MRLRMLIGALAVVSFCGAMAGASGEEAKIRVGNIDTVLTTPPDVQHTPSTQLSLVSGTADKHTEP